VDAPTSSSASRSAQELLEARDAIAPGARIGYAGWAASGLQSRIPGHSGLPHDYYAPYEANAAAYTASPGESLVLNHALIKPAVDRNQPPHEVKDVFVHVDREPTQPNREWSESGGHRFGVDPL